MVISAEKFHWVVLMRWLEDKEKNKKGCKKEKITLNGRPGMKSNWLRTHLTGRVFKWNPIWHIEKLCRQTLVIFLLQYAGDSIRSKVPPIFPERTFCQDKKLSASAVPPARFPLCPGIFLLQGHGRCRCLVPTNQSCSLRAPGPSEMHQSHLLLTHWS